MGVPPAAGVVDAPDGELDLTVWVVVPAVVVPDPAVVVDALAVVVVVDAPAPVVVVVEADAPGYASVFAVGSAFVDGAAVAPPAVVVALADDGELPRS